MNADFYAVVNAAIEDFLEHGFDTKERLDHWLEALNAAADGALIDERDLVRKLQHQLTRTFKRTTLSGKLLAVHKGVSPFTLANIRPELRAELKRRIVASAQLISLNRDASIQRTLQRFAGWATSVPKGGTDNAQKATVRKTVRRGIAGLPFEERRVIIDQGHKLVAAVNNIVATDGGAIALVWRHVKERPPAYDARPEHVARDGKVYILRDSWADKARFVKGVYYDTVTAVGEEIFCRCWAQYLYNLRDCPSENMTAKGKEALLAARKRIA